MTAPETTYSSAMHIIRTLFNAGYTAYFAGGWVRDFLLKIPTDEIDIATNAPPAQICKLFPKTIEVGIAFGVVIVVIDHTQFEVSTFRKDLSYKDGRHPEGIDFSTPEKDAQRRDFTINGMFYDPLNQEIYDFVGGKKDLQHHLIRAIGNPAERFEEDKLRLIRAVRFAARFNFKIEELTAQAIQEQAHTLLPSVSMERIWQEFAKMALFPHFGRAIIMMHRFGLLKAIFQQLSNQSLEMIEDQIRPFNDFPKYCPTICYLLQLFPNYNTKQTTELCRYLKTSNETLKLAIFLTESKQLFQQNEVDAKSWAHFYAQPSSELALKIEAAKKDSSDRISFFEQHQKRQEQLKAHIERIKQKRPLVNAEKLQVEGIQPGKTMGTLLKEAEKIAINENHTDPENVIEKLKKSPLWP